MVTVALIYEEIKWDSERVSNIKLFINKYKWEEKKLLYIKEKEICPAYISKINSNYGKKILLLMSPNKKKEDWHYHAVKELPVN